MNALTLVCVAFCLTSVFGIGEANGGGSRPVYPSSRGQRNNGNHWSSSYPAPCTFGRQLDQNGSCHRTLYPGQQSSCISGFNCNVDYPGQPGVCCLATNPCGSGTPYRRNDEAISCDTQSCPRGFRCNRGYGYAVCCRNNRICPPRGCYGG